ncbi:MAG TPA: F0F1 ATP synthase subunit epsilon [Magnetospirillaceae bacterium]|nr:F0F1 ATP synthase subunit epsilon [Magnetospirillaceae bacterium]
MTQKTKLKAKTLHVKVISPSQVFYEGPAESVSAKNKVGSFDILANHAHFFSLLTEGDIVVNTGAQQLRFPAQHGIVKVTDNVVTLFIYLPDS